MDLKQIKTKAHYLPRILAAVMVLSAFAAAARVTAYQITVKKLPAKIEKAAVINNAEDETVQKIISDSKEAAGNLKKNNLFVPQAPKPQQPTCVGIFGDLAIFGDKGYKVGEQISGAEILEIGGNEVTINWEGNEVKLVPFAKANGNYSSGKGSRGPSRGDGKPSGDENKGDDSSRPEDRGGFRGGPPGGRFGFQMSDEQRQRMMEMRQRFENASPEERERMANEFRSRMGFGGDRGGFGGRGGSDRGGDRGRGGRGR